MIISEEKQRNLFLSQYSIKYKNNIFRKEVPVFSRSVDLVSYNKGTKTISAIEFKLKNFKRVLDQILNVSICFDYLNICIPSPKKNQTKEKIIEKCSNYGIGVYFFDIKKRTFALELKPVKNRIWKIQKKQIINYLKDKNYEN